MIADFPSDILHSAAKIRNTKPSASGFHFWKLYIIPFRNVYSHNYIYPTDVMFITQSHNDNIS